MSRDRAGPWQTGAPCTLGVVRTHESTAVPSPVFLPGHGAVSSLGLAPKENVLCRFVSVPPTPLPTNDVDVYFETSADDNEHARFQKAKEQLEIRHRNRMDRVNCSTFLTFVVLGTGQHGAHIVEGKGHHLPRWPC